MNIKKHILLIVIMIIISGIVFFNFQKKDITYTTLSSPIVDIKNMVNTRGEHVDKWVKGTFKIIGTNETFEYTEKYDPSPGDLLDYNGNAVNDCITSNCKIVYFIDETYTEVGPQNISAVFNDKDNPAIGEIKKVTFYSEGKEVNVYPIPHKIKDSITYTIIYNQNGKSGQTKTYSEDLCMGNKGGGFSCFDPHYKIGAAVIFFKDNNESNLRYHKNNMNVSGKITEAELISYQYSMKPDTGEYFPVVQR